jgi:hypothetical protein
MSDKLHLHPKFRTEGKTRATVRVFLQCSLCDADIREIKPNESVDVTVAYLCTKCDPKQRITIPNTSEDQP